MKAFLIMMLLIQVHVCWALDPMTAQQALPLAKEKAEAKCSCTDLQLTDLFGAVDITGTVSHEGSDGWTFSFYSATKGTDYPVFLSQGQYLAIEIPSVGGTPIPSGWIDSNRAIGIALNANNGWLRNYLTANPSTTIGATLSYLDLENAFTWSFDLPDNESFFWINALTGEIIFVYIDPLNSNAQTWQSLKNQSLR